MTRTAKTFVRGEAVEIRGPQPGSPWLPAVYVQSSCANQYRVLDLTGFWHRTHTVPSRRIRKRSVTK